MTDKKLYSMEEVRKIIPMSKAGIYKLCAEGEINTVRLGRRVFVPSWEIDRLLDEPTDGGKTTGNMSSPENRDMENGKREKFKIN